MLRGLPSQLPPGERLLWQGSPDWRLFARSAFRWRWLALYFGALALTGVAGGSFEGALITLVTGALCLGLVALFAWATARNAVYTLTDRRIVMHIGIALPMSFNFPLARIAAADLRPIGQGHGDIALTLEGGRIAYFLLWPHARSWRFRAPQPCLRAVPDAQDVAAMLFRARARLSPVASAEAMAQSPAPQPIGVAA
jgi:hypothetical protein